MICPHTNVLLSKIMQIWFWMGYIFILSFYYSLILHHIKIIKWNISNKTKKLKTQNRHIARKRSSILIGKDWSSKKFHIITFSWKFQYQKLNRRNRQWAASTFVRSFQKRWSPILLQLNVLYLLWDKINRFEYHWILIVWIKNKK